MVRLLAILHRILPVTERSKNRQNLAAVSILTPTRGAVMTQRPTIDSNASHAIDRLVSLDVYRGMVMFLMLAEVLHLSSLAEIFTGGGYCTLSFIPLLGTMIVGLISGKLTLQSWPWGRKFCRHVAIGVGLLLSAYAIHASGACPIVKRIWTPTCGRMGMWSNGDTQLLIPTTHLERRDYSDHPIALVYSGY